MNRACFLPLALLLIAAAPAPEGAARFTADGKMIAPADYREWIFLTSGMDMNYRPGPPMARHSMFDNVFVNPGAWRVFKATGHWPEGTVLVKEGYMGSGKGSITQNGQFQSGEPEGIEAHVLDSKRFKGGWGFFFFASAAPAPMIPYTANCYECHQTHGATQTTFVQFYPTAKPIAVAHKTYEEK